MVAARANAGGGVKTRVSSSRSSIPPVPAGAGSFGSAMSGSFRRAGESKPRRRGDVDRTYNGFEDSGMQRRRQNGLTTVEMLAAVGVLMVLVSMAIPLKRWDDKRRREAELRMDLRLMRDAIDLYR